MQAFQFGSPALQDIQEPVQAEGDAPGLDNQAHEGVAIYPQEPEISIPVNGYGLVAEIPRGIAGELKGIFTSNRYARIVGYILAWKPEYAEYVPKEWNPFDLMEKKKRKKKVYRATHKADADWI